MSEILTKIGAMLNLSDPPESAESEDMSPERSAETDGTLIHECQTCGEVYLSDDPHECSTCGDMTTSVDEQE